MAMGHDVCEFLTGTEKELKDRGLWDIAKERYKLNKIYALQDDIFKNYNEKNNHRLPWHQKQNNLLVP